MQLKRRIASPTASFELDLDKVALTRRRTRIVATVGPASSSLEALSALIAAGVDVFRLNFSHGTQAGHAEVITRIRSLAEQLGRHTAILADLSGPKIRAGLMTGGALELVTGSEVTVTTRDVVGVVAASGTIIPSQYAALAADVKAGSKILLDDGNMQLQVLATDGVSEVRCVVVVGGVLKDKKGMNLPGVAVSSPAVTTKDRSDALFAAAHGVDFLALSFVRSAADVAVLKDLLVQNGHGAMPLIAKIEKPEALTAIDEIIDATDGIMVARGDLGVEMAAEEVPLIQAELVRVAIARNKPVIVATQMLESMIDNPRPTRAEVTDVAAAAQSRTDAVMLSGETAVGRFPVDAVTTMDRILRLVEGYQWVHGQHGVVAHHFGSDDDAGEALSRATSLLSRDLEVRAVVVPTRSGRTARLVSAERPAAPVVALTSDPALARRLSLSWGIVAQLCDAEQRKRPQQPARAAAVGFGLAETGQRILLVWDASQGAGEPVEPTVSILSI